MKKIKIFQIALFFAILIIPTLCWICLGDIFSGEIQEKRTLSEFPSNFDNEYFIEIDNWYKDNVPYRSTIIEFFNSQNAVLENKYRMGLSTKLSLLSRPSWYADDSPYFAPISDNKVIYGKEDWLFYEAEGSVEYYKGSNLLTIDEMIDWNNSFENLNEKCLEKGINLVIMVPPNKEQIYPEYMPSYKIDNQEKRENVFYDFMKNNSDVNYIYLYDDLISIKNAYVPYYKQDTHWNSIGAYVGLTKLYEVIGYQTIDLRDLNMNIVYKNGGDLSEMCGYSSDYIDYVIEYKNNIKVTEQILYDGYIKSYKSNSENKNKIVVISDSFREAMEQYIKKDFSESYICHRTYLDNKKTIEAIKNLEAGDVLLIMPVERFDYTNVDVVNDICNYLQD